MISAQKPQNEADRVRALESYDIMDTLPEEDFDDITQIASELCGTPISLVSLIDPDRQWFKSHHGLDATETPREYAFCAHAILEPEEIFEVPDSSKDERFHDNPLAAGPPDVIFYAGAPLVNEDGYSLGTLCVIDNKPNELSKKQKKALRSLARQVVALLELKRKNTQLTKTSEELKEANHTLEQFAYVASHDIKSPLNNIVSLAGTIDQFYGDKLDEEGNKMIRLLKESAKSSHKLVEEILTYSVLTSSDNIKIELVDSQKLVDEINQNLQIPEGFTIKTNGSLPELNASRTILYQIFQNIISNSIRYGDKPEGWIEISCKKDNGNWIFEFLDNGPGINEKYHEKIFQMFQTFENKDRFGNKGTGIGLATVRKLTMKLGGNISIQSKLGEGTTFIVEIPSTLEIQE